MGDTQEEEEEEEEEEEGKMHLKKGSCTPVDPMSLSLLLVSLNLSFVTKINVSVSVLFVVEDKTRAILSKETTEELAIVKLEMNTNPRLEIFQAF